LKSVSPDWKVIGEIMVIRISSSYFMDNGMLFSNDFILLIVFIFRFFL